MSLRRPWEAIQYLAAAAGCAWSPLSMEINRGLVLAGGTASGREVQMSAGVIDSQGGKTSKIGHFSAYDWGKRIKERRRHIIIDTCANLIAREFHTADSQVQLRAFLGSSL